MSEKVAVTPGVPQGAVLDPLLFLVKDFPDYIKHCTLRLCADYSNIYREINNIDDAKLLQQLVGRKQIGS